MVLVGGTAKSRRFDQDPQQQGKKKQPAQVTNSSSTPPLVKEDGLQIRTKRKKERRTNGCAFAPSRMEKNNILG